MPERAVNENHYLYWVDDPGHHLLGWLIRIPYGSDGKRLTWRKLLSVRRYNKTKERLKIDALKLRNEMMRTLKVYDPGLGMLHRKRSRRNTSGVVGVRPSRYHKNGKSIEFWEARWKKADGKIGRKVFTIALYGSERARELAICAREQALKRRGEAATRKREKTSRMNRSSLRARLD